MKNFVQIFLPSEMRGVNISLNILQNQSWVASFGFYPFESLI